MEECNFFFIFFFQLFKWNGFFMDFFFSFFDNLTIFRDNERKRTMCVYDFRVDSSLLTQKLLLSLLLISGPSCCILSLVVK